MFIYSRFLLVSLFSSALLVCASRCSNGESAASPSRQSSTPTSGVANANFPIPAEPAYWPTTSWLTQTPEEQGFPAGAFQNLANEAATDLPYHTSLMVIRNGYIIHESYHDTSGSWAHW